MPFTAPAEYFGAVQPPTAPISSALWFVFRENDLLVSSTGIPAGSVPQLPVILRPEALGFEVAHVQYLGRLGPEHCYACDIAASVPAASGWEWRGLRSLFTRLPDAQFALAGRALQLVDWDRTHGFCSRCGTPTAARTTERARECPACGLVVYPRIAPAIMALVRRAPDEILLARSPRFPRGMYSALAGFVEPGESLEQCLQREVREEVGLEVENVRYFASQPWPFPHSLMIAFTADWKSGEIHPDPLEIEAAQWFNVRSLPPLPHPISISRRLIDAVVAAMIEKRD